MSRFREHLLAKKESICYRLSMDAFHTYLKGLTKEKRAELAEKVGTSVAYLWQIAYKQRRCKESMAIELEKATARSVRMEDLRPDVDWEYVRSSAQSIAESSLDVGDRLESSDDVQPPAGTSERKEGD
ncbi:transcriptional regulator [Burkholderia ubonensis]|uniref:transcriptional regulator n=1 Tax=Burkholderia ubonensis TaxID=101571 RepID=UPI0007C65188|nr:YdaS family helix-turn-helix protein [Burkholderia ubonensis]